ATRWNGRSGGASSVDRRACDVVVIVSPVRGRGARTPDAAQLRHDRRPERVHEQRVAVRAADRRRAHLLLRRRRPDRPRALADRRHRGRHPDGQGHRRVRRRRGRRGDPGRRAPRQRRRHGVLPGRRRLRGGALEDRRHRRGHRPGPAGRGPGRPGDAPRPRRARRPADLRHGVVGPGLRAVGQRRHRRAGRQGHQPGRGRLVDRRPRRLGRQGRLHRRRWQRRVPGLDHRRHRGRHRPRHRVRRHRPPRRRRAGRVQRRALLQRRRQRPRPRAVEVGRHPRRHRPRHRARDRGLGPVPATVRGRRRPAVLRCLPLRRRVPHRRHAPGHLPHRPEPPQRPYPRPRVHAVQRRHLLPRLRPVERGGLRPLADRRRQHGARQGTARLVVRRRPRDGRVRRQAVHDRCPRHQHVVQPGRQRDLELRRHAGRHGAVRQLADVVPPRAARGGRRHAAVRRRRRRGRARVLADRRHAAEHGPPQGHQRDHARRRR
ncbi:MAG: hypothetical protein AVDCRST_MAG64-612, partial [uncultured Phycisphaerae bacterium]